MGEHGWALHRPLDVGGQRAAFPASRRALWSSLSNKVRSRWALPRAARTMVSLRYGPVHDQQPWHAGELPHVARYHGAAGSPHGGGDPQVRFTDGRPLRLQMNTDGHIMLFDLSVRPRDAEKAPAMRSRAPCSAAGSRSSPHPAAIRHGLEAAQPHPQAVSPGAAALPAGTGHAGRTPRCWCPGSKPGVAPNRR